MRATPLEELSVRQQALECRRGCCLEVSPPAPFEELKNVTRCEFFWRAFGFVFHSTQATCSKERFSTIQWSLYCC